MDLLTFARLHGILVDALPPPGVWKRYPTVDKPRSDNGAIRYMGTHAFVQNHATMPEVATWRPDADAVTPNMERIAEQAQAFERKKVDGYGRASARADELMRLAVPTNKHGYMIRKGLAEQRVLVLPVYTRRERTEAGDWIERSDENVLLVPMRDLQTNKTLGAQLIYWDADSFAWVKKMLPGMRAKGAVLRLGPPRVRETWLVEGFATGVSLLRALEQLRMSAAVLVCFSDGNLVHAATHITGPAFVYADNDVSQAGQRAAERSGWPWCMSDTVGHDANDDHRKHGLLAVCRKVMSARAMEPVP